jgi:hypothetical protein
VTANYRPGQLYTGRDGDLLFVVLPGNEAEFVTNRGTRVTVEQAMRVYAPLTLIRDVGGSLPREVVELAEVIREVLVVPRPANWMADEHAFARLQRDRALSVNAALAVLLRERIELQTAVQVIREVAEHEPVTYTPCELEDGAPVYAPGAEIPGQPGYVVGTCGHRVAGSEWRAGFRTCERCGGDWEDPGNGADFFACDHKTIDDPGHDPKVCPRLSEEQMQALSERLQNGGER